MIREATSADLETLAHLMEHVQTVHAAAHPELFKAAMDGEAVKAFFAALQDKPDNTILVHAGDGGADGYVWFELNERAENFYAPARRQGYIHHISVAPEARKSGIGRALVNETRARLRAAGAVGIGVDYWAFNTRASQFFAKLGFVPQRQVAFAAIDCGG